MITERQEKILNTVVQEYVRSAQPVSSKLLEKKYGFDVSPATIRIEMQKLTDAGFICQPHTSAGRVPTDKGYRLFVNKLLEEKSDGGADAGLKKLFEYETEDTIKLLQSLTRDLARISSDFAFSCLPQEELFWKEGWEEVLSKPEFQEKGTVSHFASMIKNIEENIEDLEPDSRVKIFIGGESPFPKTREFSIILTKCSFPGKEEGVLAILGPKRMTYDKNISLINSAAKLLNRSL